MPIGTIVWSRGTPDQRASSSRTGAGNDQATLLLLIEDRIVERRAAALSESERRCSSGNYPSSWDSRARIADALSRDEILTPIESSLIPLPHQFLALARAISSDRIRFLLADEVGLGKTIEAGLILRELKLRGLVKRTLVVAPKGSSTSGSARCVPILRRSSGGFWPATSRPTAVLPLGRTCGGPSTRSCVRWTR